MNIVSKGIDISRWQGDFNMDKAVAEGFSFAIIKAGGGDDGMYKDSRFEKNYENAKRLGIPVGAYWFSKALTVEQARAEADWFASCLTVKQFELPVYMDVEHRAMLDLGKRKLTDIIHAFCQRMEELGYWVGIYSSQSFFSTYMIDSELQRYAHWVACWGTSCSYQGDCFGMWQYGGETNKIRSNKVAGVVCDQNYMLIDYPALIKARGLNGFQKAEESDSDTGTYVPITVDLPVLRKGDTGDTVRALQTLLIGLGYSCGAAGADGAFGDDTENAVMALQEDAELPGRDGIVGGMEWHILMGL